MTTSIQTVLQKIAILLTGHGANATQLQELEGFAGADGKYAALVQGINHFLETQTKASSAATIVSQLAKNGLGLSLGATDATGIANYITDNKLSWSDVVVTCLQMGGSAGVTLDNRAAAVNTFLDQLRTSDKTDLFAGTSVLQTVKNLVGNIDANTVSLNNAQAGFSTLSSILSSNGIRGSVVDGYVKGATVFVDANSDGKLNDGEFFTTTDASGYYNLPLNAGIGKLIASGGTDILTGKPFKGVMTALPGSTTINPISTLIEAVGSKAQSLAELANTTSTVQKALGLPSNINLLTYDPLAVLADSTASAADKATALAVQKTALQIQNIITQVGNTLDAGSTSVTAVSAAEAITDTLASLISHSSTTVDLTDATLLAGVIQSSATQLGLSTTATQAGQIAAVTSASNTAAQTASDITKLGQVADVAQGGATDALIAAAGGNGSFSSVASNFTGSSLQTAINNADVGDIAAGVPAPTPATTPTTPIDTSSSTPSSTPSTPTPQSDLVAPTMTGATVSANGTTLTITYSETVTGTVEKGDYALAGNTITNATLSGNTVTLTLGTPVITGTTVSNLVYTATAGAANSIKDAATPTHNAAATQTLAAVTNNSTVPVPDTTAPTMSSAAIAANGTTLTITYSEPLTGTPEAGDYALTGNTITNATLSGSTVTLTLGTPVITGTTVSNLVYTATAGTADSIKDAATTPNAAATQTLAAVTNGSTVAPPPPADTTAPTMSSAAVSTDGTQIVITYSEPLTAGTVDTVDYIVAGSTVNAATIGTGADNNKVTLTLASALNSAATVSSIAYTASTGTPNSIKDAATTPNNAADQTLTTNITNGSTVAPVTGTAPVLVTPQQAFRVDPATSMTQIFFNEPVHAGTGNIVLVDDTSSTNTNISVTDTSKIEITTWNTSQGKSKLHTNALGLVAGHNYHLEIPAGAILDSSNESFAGISDPTGIVLNVVADATPPYMQNAVVSANGTTLTLTYFEPIAGTAEAVDFTVGGNTVTNAAFGTGASNNKVILTLGTPVTSANLTGVTYTAANGTPDSIKDMANPPNAAYDMTIQGSQITYDGIVTAMYTGTSSGYPIKVDPTWNSRGVTFNAPVHAGTGNLVLVNDSGGANISIDVTDTNKVSFYSYTDGNGGAQRGQLTLHNPNLGLTVGNKYHLEIPSGAILRNSDNVSFSGLTDPTAIVWNVIADATPPSMQSAVVAADGTTLTITYSEALTGTAEAVDYTVGGNTVTNAAFGTGASNNKVILTLGTPVTTANLTGITYTAANGTPNSIKDMATPANVVSYMDTLQPSGITYDGMLTLLQTGSIHRVEPTMNQSIANFSAPVHAGTGNLMLRNDSGGTDISIDVTNLSKVSFSSYTNGNGDQEGYLSINNANLGLVIGQKYHLEIPAGAVLRNGDNVPFGGLTVPTAIVLDVVADAQSPWMRNASVAADGTTLTITYDEPLAGSPEAVDYTVAGNTVTNAVFGTGANNKDVILTLGTPVTSANLTGVTYTAANGTPDSIKDMATPANAAYNMTTMVKVPATLNSARVSTDGTQIIITHSDQLTGTPVITDYTINGNVITAANRGLNGNEVILTLGTAVMQGANVSNISYTASTLYAFSKADLPVTNGSAINGDTRMIHFFHDFGSIPSLPGLISYSPPQNGDFFIDPSIGNYGIIFSERIHAGTGNIVFIDDTVAGGDISVDVTDTSKVTLAPERMNALFGALSFNNAAIGLVTGHNYHLSIPSGAILNYRGSSFTGISDSTTAVVHMVADALPPIMTNAIVSSDGMTLTLTYSEPLAGLPETVDYTVSGNTVTAATIGTGADNNKVILTLGSTAAPAFDVTYTAFNGTPNSITDVATPANAAYDVMGQVKGSSAVQAVWSSSYIQSVATFGSTDILAFKDSAALNLTGTSTKVFNSGTATGITPTATDNIWVITDAQPTWTTAAAIDAAMASATAAGMDNGLVLVFNNGTENQVWYVGSAHTDNGSSTNDHSDVVQLSTVTLTGNTTLADLTAANFFVY